MHTQVNFLWDDGFPTKVHLIAASTYQLTVCNIEVEGRADHGILRVVLLPDGEYCDWREADEHLALLFHFAEILEGSTEWNGNTFSWKFPLDPSWGEEKVEAQLLERYCSFLAAASIPLTSKLVPIIEWQRGEF